MNGGSPGAAEELRPFADAVLRGDAHPNALAACGVVDPARWRSELSVLLAALPQAEAPRRDLVATLLGSARPDAALTGLAAWHARRPAEGARLLEAGGRRLARVLGNSDFLARRVERQPELAETLWGDDPLTPRTAETFAALAAELDGDPAPALRALRYREMLRITARDLEGAPVGETGAEIADLADACIDAALRHVRTRHAARDPLGVVAMGKLGGRELNYSSDVDLLFVYGSDHDKVGERREDLGRIVGDVRRLLAEVTDDGFVFRVDLELRPEGRQGPLVSSTAALLDWYEAWGSDWERIAWIRARPCAGDRPLVAELIDALRPFVYPRSGSFDAIRGVHDLKQRIEAEARDAGNDVKRGPGGIREAEFFVQSLQALYGGRHPEVRCTRTADALDALAGVGVLPEALARELGACYDFLRRVENRLQMVEDRQTQQLPADPARLQTLARRMGYADPDGFGAARDFVRDLERARARVRATFESLLQEPLRDAEGGERSAWLDACRTPQAFADEVVAAVPEALWQSVRPAAERVADRIFTRCPEEARALGPMPGVARRLGLFLAADSEGVTRLARRPQLVSAFRDDASLPDDTRDALAAQTRDLDDVESALDALRVVRQDTCVRVAAAQIGGRLQPPGVEAALTDTAEIILERAVDLARHQVERLTGRPLHDGAPVPLCVLGLGSLGAREMIYQSDLDLIFVYGAEGTSAGPREVQSREHFALVAQRLISYLATPTGAGRAYSIDTRLRPSGQAGTLVVDLEGFRQYHEREAQTWEAQSLLRARPVAGEAAFGAEVAACVEAALFGRPPRDDLAAEILRMRGRVAEEQTDSREGVLDLKYAPGGLVDASFLAQFLALRHGRERPDLRLGATATALAQAGREGLLDDAGAVVSAYWTVRRCEAALRLATGRPVSGLESDGPVPWLVAALCDAHHPRELEAQIRAAQATLRDAFVRHVR